jgi:protein TonB
LLHFIRVPSAEPWRQRLRAGLPRRVLALGAALVLEALLLALLWTLGQVAGPAREKFTIVDFKSRDMSEDTPEPPAPEPKPAHAPAPQQVQPQAPVPPSPAAVAQPSALPPPAAVIPVSPQQVVRAEAAPAPPAPAKPGVRMRSEASGPPGSAGFADDTARVGTAPNGEPMYAAAWYREPYDDELRGYLSTASGPGWGLIACRTVPDFRVDDCVALDEYPENSNINRAVLAAAWQFRVRPPRRGGQSLVGAWVRIRIDYELRRKS